MSVRQINMAKIVQQFTTDDKDVQRAFDKLIQQVQKLEGAQKKASKESKEGADAFAGSVKKGVGELQGMASGLVSVTAAVGAAKQAYADWRREMEQIGQTAIDVEQSLTKTLFGSGDLARLPQIRKQLDQIKGLTDNQRSQFFDAISGAAPGASEARRVGLTAELGRFGAVADTNLARTLGEFSEIFAGSSTGDVADKAIFASQAAGSRASQLSSPEFLKGVQTLVANQVTDADTAVGLGLATLDKNFASDVIFQLANKVSGDIDPRGLKTGETLTDEDRLFNRFATASPQERLKLALTDKDVATAALGGELASRTLQLGAGALGRGGDLRAAAAGDFAAQQAGLLSGTVAQTIQDDAVQLEESEKKLRADAIERKRLDDFVTRNLNDRDANFLERFSARGNVAVSETFGAIEELFGFGRQSTGETLRRSNQFSEEQIQAFLGEQVKLQQRMVNALENSAPSINPNPGEGR